MSDGGVATANLRSNSTTTLEEHDSHNTFLSQLGFGVARNKAGRSWRGEPPQHVAAPVASVWPALWGLAPLCPQCRAHARWHGVIACVCAHPRHRPPPAAPTNGAAVRRTTQGTHTRRAPPQPAAICSDTCLVARTCPHTHAAPPRHTVRDTPLCAGPLSPGG